MPAGKWFVIVREGYGGHSLRHVVTGLKMVPPSFKTRWRYTEMRRAAKLLAAQGDEPWSRLTPEASRDGKHPDLLAAYAGWMRVLHEMFPEEYPNG